MNTEQNKKDLLEEEDVINLRSKWMNSFVQRVIKQTVQKQLGTNVDIRIKELVLRQGRGDISGSISGTFEFTPRDLFKSSSSKEGSSYIPNRKLFESNMHIQFNKLIIEQRNGRMGGVLDISFKFPSDVLFNLFPTKAELLSKGDER